MNKCRVYGVEPEGAKLVVKAFSHDFGRYYEVCVKFDCDNEAAQEYAYKCESGLDKWPVKEGNYTMKVFIVQGNYGQGWEDVASDRDYCTAKDNLVDYRQNDGIFNYRLIERRVTKDDYRKGEF